MRLAERPDPETLVARIRERKGRMSRGISTESILRHLDADRR
jgi:hypothetical protein